MATIGTLSVILSANDSALNKSLRRAERNVLAFGRKLEGIGNSAWRGMRNAALAAGAAGGAILALNKSAANYADEIGKMSQKTGISTETLSRLRFAADQADLDFSSLATASRGLNNALLDAGNGGATAEAAFTQLGLSSKRLQALSPDQRMMAVFEALTKVEDAGRRAALAQNVFGKAGQDVLPLLSDGYAALQRQMAQASQYGLVVGPEQAAAAAAFNDSITRLGMAFRGLTLQASTFQPLTRAIDAIGQSINRIRESGAFAQVTAAIANLVQRGTELVERFLLSWQNLSTNSRQQLLYIAGGLTAFVVFWRTGFLGAMLSSLTKAVPFIFAHFKQIAAAGTALVSFYVGLKIGNAIERSFDLSGLLLKIGYSFGLFYDIAKATYDKIVSLGKTNFTDDIKKIGADFDQKMAEVDKLAEIGGKKIGFWDAISEEFSAAGFAKDFSVLKGMLGDMVPDGLQELFSGMGAAKLEIAAPPELAALTGGINGLSETITAASEPTRLAGIERGSVEDFRATLASRERTQSNDDYARRAAMATERTASKLDEIASLLGDEESVRI